MFNTFPPFNDIEKQLQEQMREWNNQKNNQLRKMFGKYIKQNIMIKLKEDIITSAEFNEILPQCYSLNFSPILAIGTDDIDFDICKNLAMINSYLMLPISCDEKLKSEQYKNSEYISTLKSRTILQCKLRKLVQNYGEENLLLSHSPINFSMHCIVNFLLDKIDENIRRKNRPTVPNANFKINTLVVMLKTIRSILFLTEYDDCGSAFSLLRTLIETFFVYLAIYDNEKVANDYYKFMEYREEYEVNGIYSEEFERIAPLNCNKQNFLSYGWLDKLQGKHHNYVFSEVMACNRKTNEEENNAYLKAYKYCCKYAHGNYLNQGIPPYSFIWILTRAGGILINILRQFPCIFKEKTIYKDIDLDKYLTENVNEAIDIYIKIHEN